MKEGVSERGTHPLSKITGKIRPPLCMSKKSSTFVPANETKLLDGLEIFD